MTASSGSVGHTVEGLSGTYATDSQRIANNFAELLAVTNALLVDLTNVKKVLNSLIDAQQALGLVG